MKYHTHKKSSDRYKDLHNNRWNSLVLHISIEIILDRVAKPASIFQRGWLFQERDNKSNIRNFVYKLIKIPHNIVYGFNCGFSTKDIMSYLIYNLRKEGLN